MAKKRDRYEDDEDDDDEDEKPRRRRKPSKKKGLNPVLLIALAGGAVLFLAVGAGLVFYLTKETSKPGAVGEPDGMGLGIAPTAPYAGKPMTFELFTNIRLGVPIAEVERYLGDKGKVIPSSEWNSTIVDSGRQEYKLRSLTVLGPPAGSDTPVVNWYLWTDGKSRIFVATQHDKKKAEIAAIMFAEYDGPKGKRYVSSRSDSREWWNK